MGILYKKTPRDTAIAAMNARLKQLPDTSTQFLEDMCINSRHLEVQDVLGMYDSDRDEDGVAISSRQGLGEAGVTSTPITTTRLSQPPQKVTGVPKDHLNLYACNKWTERTEESVKKENKELLDNFGNAVVDPAPKKECDQTEAKFERFISSIPKQEKEDGKELEAHLQPSKFITSEIRKRWRTAFDNCEHDPYHKRRKSWDTPVSNSYDTASPLTDLGNSPLKEFIGNRRYSFQMQTDYIGDLEDKYRYKGPVIPVERLSSQSPSKIARFPDSNGWLPQYFTKDEGSPLGLEVKNYNRRANNRNSPPASTSTENIKHITSSAALEIDKSKKLCDSIKERLGKYNHPKERLPGAYIQYEYEEPIEDTSTLVSENIVFLPTRPVDYATNCFFIPALIKTIYFFSFHCFFADNANYNFTRTCKTMLQSDSLLTLPQLDTIILYCAELWFLTKSIEFVLTWPWKFYKLTSEYKDCVDFGIGRLERYLEKPNSRLKVFCEKHATLSNKFKDLGFLTMVFSPIVLISIMFVVHGMTFGIISWKNSWTSLKAPVYTVLGKTIVSHSQVVMLAGCFICSYTLDGCKFLEEFIKDETNDFFKDSQCILSEITEELTENNIVAQSSPVDNDGEDFSEHQSLQRMIPPIKKDQNSTEKLKANKYNNVQLDVFSPLPYESPLTGKSTVKSATLKPVSPWRPKKQNKTIAEDLIKVPFSILNVLIYVPYVLVILYYKLIHSLVITFIGIPSLIAGFATDIVRALFAKKRRARANNIDTNFV